MFERSPSVQSLVIGSRIPYSSTTVAALGFRVYSLVARPSLCWETYSVEYYIHRLTSVCAWIDTTLIFNRKNKSACGLQFIVFVCVCVSVSDSVCVPGL